ncbi:MAG: class I SAM-dependent methyltransferase [Pseudomonadales bacterium]|nr:class I SAM-dependent methyltransferase [Pseudomonadales bacterium]
METDGLRYERIGRGYTSTRREDPVVSQYIASALGGAKTVLNVGAGAGSYEPGDRQVIAIEPSAVMVAQRSHDAAPVIRAIAKDLPLADASIDAAMTMLSIHHWAPFQREGVEEMCRVARGRVIVVTVDPVVSGNMWLMADYLHEVRELDHQIFPAPVQIADWIGGGSVETIPVRRDTPDWTLMSFWAHPERVLDERARSATSGFARQPPAVVQRVVDAVSRDLESGEWDKRHGHLRELDEFDAGLRLVVGQSRASSR